ncbi:MAG: TatD family hydrolase [Bacteroidota bacterium]|nr:TatD family hydrolase [Bacteroidota bacterium]
MKYINLHTHDKTDRKCEISILNIFPDDAEKALGQHIQKIYSIGLHPWHIDKTTANAIVANIDKLARHPSILAIGEIGLDRRCAVDFQLQKEVLVKQLEIAEILSKPVIWHVVKAYSDVLALKKNIQPAVPWILHGFHAKEQLTISLVGHGFYFSFGVLLLDEKSRNAEILPLIPTDKLFFENDDSGIPIEKIYEKAAGILSLSLEKLKQIVNENFIQVFGKENK